jgi:cytochrome c biogenesis protein CcdA
MVFLLGVEVGVLLLALASASVLLSLSRFEWYRKSVVTPVGVLVAGYAVFTLVERWI